MEHTLDLTRELAEAPAAESVPSVAAARQALQQVDANKVQLAKFRSLVSTYRKLIRVH